MGMLSPSMMCADFFRLGDQITELERLGIEYLHIDVMDGNFVPNHSFSPSVVKGCRGASNLILDVHLMILEPVKYVENYCRAGADYLTVHVEADTEENIHAALDKTTALGVRCGVVVKPKTPAEAVLPFLHKCDMVLVMTVEPGFGGQKFMADMMPKLAKIRQYINEIKPDCHLEVDGGVDTATAPLCIHSGANVLVAGSAVYKAADIEAKIKELRG